MYKSITSILLILFAISLTGCSASKESEDVAVQRSNLRSLAAAYGSYQKSNRGRIPKNEKTLRAWIEKNGGAGDYQAQNIDEMFVSSRDDEPYVVVYGKPKKGTNVVAYEAVGVDGSRYIADDLGNVEELDAATFGQRVPDAE